MKNHCNKNSLLFVFALISLISAGIHFAEFELSGPSNSDYADKGNDISAKLNDPTLKQQKFDRKDRGFASSEKNDQPRPMEPEIAITPVSDDNFNIPAVGEHADQINQDAIIAKAKAKGYQAQLTEPESAIPPISNKDADAPSTGEYADQINQQDIIAKAKGYQAQSIEPESAIPPISNKNVDAPSTGKYADQINQQDIIAKAKLEGYLAPDGP
jgi:hypothetical protein